MKKVDFFSGCFERAVSSLDAARYSADNNGKIGPNEKTPFGTLGTIRVLPYGTLHRERW